MKKIRIFTTLILLLIIFWGSNSQVYAGPTYRFEGQNYYDGANSGYPSGHGYCNYQDRPVTQYFGNLERYLQYKSYTLKGTWFNQSAWENDLTYGTDRVDDATLFAFGGHGLDFSYPEAQNNDYESSLHFYTLNSSTDFHSSGDHANRQANATWSEIRWGNNIDYSIIWSCNFLHTGGSTTNLNKIFSMFDGMHIMVGFASKMYMDPWEGELFGGYLYNGQAIKDAWSNATQQCQYQIGTTTVYAAWACHTSHEGDTLNTHYDPPTYASSPSSYVRKFYTVAN